jgi:hypothetical protein
LEFIINKVLEDKIEFIISKTDYFMKNNFNAPLYEKLFVVLKKPKSTSSLVWMNLNNALKIYIISPQ